MEDLEIDDINFYPCACGYQVSHVLAVSLTLERYVDSAGIEFASMKMGYALPVDKPTRKTQPNTVLYLRTK
jgi:hypothetical protein